MERYLAIADLRRRLRLLQRERIQDKAIELRSGLMASGLTHVILIGAIIVGLPDFDDHEPLLDTTSAMQVVFESSAIDDSLNQTTGQEEEVLNPTSAQPVPPTPQTSEQTAKPIESNPEPVTDTAAAQKAVTEELQPEPVKETAQVADQAAIPEEQLVEALDFQELNASTFSQALPSPPPVPQETVAEDLPAPIPPAPAESTADLPVADPVPAENTTAATALDTASQPDGATTQEASASQAVAPQPAAISAAPSARLTADEIAALKSQLRRHWQLPDDIAGLAGISVKVRIVMNSDRTPQDVTIVDLGRYGSDSAYRRVADSAVRAVWDAGRSKLILPAEKYDQWATITVTFDLNERAMGSSGDYVAALPSAPALETPPASPSPQPATATGQDAPAAAAAVAPSPAPTTSDAKLTDGEIKVFIAQIKRLWVIPAAFQNSNMKVQVKIDMNPDGTVERAVIVDQARYQGDSVFRVLADSVLKAIQAASNEGFALPGEKFSAWSEINIAFDPKWKN